MINADHPEWSSAVRDRDSTERDAFLEAHLDLVKYLATRIASRLPLSVDVDDLIHDGVLGLMDATDRFDPARAVRFRTYAETRIRGAIMDGLRRKDWKPRSLRQRKRRLDDVVSRLAASRSRAATEDEIAVEMGMSVEDYRGMLSELHVGVQLSLDELVGDGEPTLTSSDDTDGPVEKAELLRLLAEEVQRLPGRERQVLELYYFNNLNMKEVGAVLGVTESRVCQLHAQAASRMRTGLESHLHASMPAGSGAGRG